MTRLLYTIRIYVFAVRVGKDSCNGTHEVNHQYCEILGEWFMLAIDGCEASRNNSRSGFWMVLEYVLTLLVWARQDGVLTLLIVTPFVRASVFTGASLGWNIFEHLIRVVFLWGVRFDMR